MFATATDNAVILFIIAALLFFAYAIYELVVNRPKWTALMPLGLMLCAIAFAIIYHQSV